MITPQFYTILDEFEKTSTIPYINGEYIISEFRPSFGHRLLETITQSWVFKYFPNARMLLNPLHKRSKFLYDFIKPFNIDEGHLFVPEPVCVVEKLYIPTRSYMHGQYITRTAMDIWKRIRDFYAPAIPAPHDKIYLSRSNIKARPLLNEDECIKLFIDYGFSCVNMEKLSIQEQINTIYNAAYVAGPLGSAMHNLVFSHENIVGTLILSQRDKRLRMAYGNIESCYHRVFNIVYGSSVIEFGRPWVMDVKNLERALLQWLEA
jgi:capsular polysaccharide biosynthesis protein